MMIDNHDDDKLCFCAQKKNRYEFLNNDALVLNVGPYTYPPAAEGRKLFVAYTGKATTAYPLDAFAQFLV